MTPLTCGTCRYFESYTGNGVGGGECHANPPTVIHRARPEVNSSDRECRFYEVTR